jgi:archaellum component FlaC
MLTERCSEKYVKKLIGRTDIEDALKRLDKLTQEESRMAAAENLKVTHAVDERVKGVADTAAAIDNRVADVDERVAGVGDQVAGVGDQVAGVDERVAGVVDRVAGVDDQVQRTANDVDEIKRWSSLTSVLPSAGQEPNPFFQKTNCGRTFTNGSLRRTPRRTTTSHVVLITRNPQPGFFKAASFRTGNQLDRSYGSTENVRPIFFLT